MIDRIKQFLIDHSSEEAFFKLIGMLFGEFSEEYMLIKRAYHLSEKAFEGKQRDSGAPFFEHQKHATLLYIFTGGQDEVVIAALLMHDVPEDVSGWTIERVAKEVNKPVAQKIFGVTKPDVAAFDDNKNLRNAYYFIKLIYGKYETRMMKLCDHLVNLIDIEGLSEPKLAKLIGQCKNLYLPMAIHSQFLFRETLQALEIAEAHHASLTAVGS
jgi:guanosine-3',5'-bis(diphosphate) 3'-pyrophosphohydrolase